MRHLSPAQWNLTAPFLYEEAIRRRQGEIGLGGSFVVNTGFHTGRSPKDKYIADEPGTKKAVARRRINRPLGSSQFDRLHQRLLSYRQVQDLFVHDVCTCADPDCT